MTRDAGSMVIDAPLIGTRAQQHWDVPHATWFTLMGVGGGVFLLSRLLGLEADLGVWLGLPVVDVVSFVTIAIGGALLISTLGRPLRFLRAVLRPGSSWISRGAIADFVFLVAGGVLVLPGLTLGGVAPLAWLPWEATAEAALGRGIEVVALLSAAVVIFYAGQVLADANGIPYWRSPAIPAQFVCSSLAGSMSLVMLLETLNRRAIGTTECVLLVLFLAGLLATIGAHLATRRAAPGKSDSVGQLVHGRFRAAFVGGVIVAGTLLPMVLAAFGVALPWSRDAVGVVTALATLAGGFLLRLVTLRVGVYAPVHATLRLRRR